MKKTCLILSVVLLCAFFSSVQAEVPETCCIENTLWRLFPYTALFGFSDGVVYVCDEEGSFCSPVAHASYATFYLFALFYLPLGDEYPGFIFGFVPSYRNIGRVVIYNYRLAYALRGRLFKISEDWMPEG